MKPKSEKATKKYRLSRVSTRPHGYINRLANVQTFRQKSSHAFGRVKRYLQHTLLVERDEISVHIATIESTDINFVRRKMSPSITSDNRGDFSTHNMVHTTSRTSISNHVLCRSRLLFVRSSKLVKKKSIYVATYVYRISTEWLVTNVKKKSRIEYQCF